jgi:hypothetical protein
MQQPVVRLRAIAAALKRIERFETRRPGDRRQQREKATRGKPRTHTVDHANLLSPGAAIGTVAAASPGAARLHLCQDLELSQLKGCENL